ncbi:hypothetical protein BN940_12281 [Castellaniella defragrans 65Phen]|uniref:Uncharacterized protein n=1 Tax=Castellaniella defragrans (strain DSM 12143 / CCUG 39792 / 65Phen) TaxID=1437824 RepID=W8X4L9_CASD6|nr:hypothetical protein BN940_12281 [Castellaniella defragrans 65Phen]
MNLSPRAAHEAEESPMKGSPRGLSSAAPENRRPSLQPTLLLTAGAPLYSRCPSLQPVPLFTAGAPLYSRRPSLQPVLFSAAAFLTSAPPRVGPVRAPCRDCSQPVPAGGAHRPSCPGGAPHRSGNPHRSSVPHRSGNPHRSGAPYRTSWALPEKSGFFARLSAPICPSPKKRAIVSFLRRQALGLTPR